MGSPLCDTTRVTLVGLNEWGSAPAVGRTIK